MSAGNRIDPVKVVIINTQYVQTDATSFKSVVQRFTGKDSKIEIEQTAGFKDNPIRFQSGIRMSSSSSSAAAGYSPVMSRGMSFKDLDRLLRDLPPLEELYNLIAD